MNLRHCFFTPPWERNVLCAIRLDQVGGCPATLAGAAFLPFTVLMAVLSRWSGGLLDRFGPRLPLVIGPAIGALGIAVMALIVQRGSYWQFLGAIVILGFGMVVTVAPLTTTVINAVPAHQVGVASGVNNAVSSVANLLAVAIPVASRSDSQPALVGFTNGRSFGNDEAGDRSCARTASDRARARQGSRRR